jgi:hypothetical protein
MESKVKVFICDCHSYEHQAIFHSDEETQDLYVSIHLITHKNILKRVWYAVKYICGIKSKFGAWDEFIFKPEDKRKLRKYLEMETI